MFFNRLMMYQYMLIIYCMMYLRSKFHYQLDHHFLVRRKFLNRVSDACAYGALVLCSDHTPIRMKLRVARNLKHKTARPVTLRVNRDLLKSPAVRSDFLDEIVKADRSLSPARFKSAKGSVCSQRHSCHIETSSPWLVSSKRSRNIEINHGKE